MSNQSGMYYTKCLEAFIEFDLVYGFGFAHFFHCLRIMTLGEKKLCEDFVKGECKATENTERKSLVQKCLPNIQQGSISS